MILAGLMTPAGMEKIKARMDEPFVPARDILDALKEDPQTWKNSQAFPNGISASASAGPKPRARNRKSSNNACATSSK
jgi:hypothetical protein